MSLRKFYSRVRRFFRHSGGICVVRGKHKTKRLPLGHRCLVCRRAAADYEDFGLTGGYVDPLRTLYSRKNGGEITQTSAYEPGPRGW